jgi:hypothetical protein
VAESILCMSVLEPPAASMCCCGKHTSHSLQVPIEQGSEEGKRGNSNRGSDLEGRGSQRATWGVSEDGQRSQGLQTMREVTDSE